jgi:predicted enzyme related to lactoylglutathione lyase
MKLISAYIETEDFKKSINFYKKVLQIEPIVFCENRWVEFELGNKIALYNKKFDEQKIKDNSNIEENYNKAYIDDFNSKKSDKKNNIVTFNFYTENLKDEYERIKKLKICDVSEVMYVNIVEPYYYFNVSDPDGNLLEICSDKYE